MASADELMREAQYAFQNISFGDSPDNRKNSARALSLATKVLRKYPSSPEATVARSILWRLGDEAYVKKFNEQHIHAVTVEGAHAHSYAELRSAAAEEPIGSVRGGTERLDWQRLTERIFRLPKTALIMFVFAGTFLFGIFGPLLFIPLAMLVIFVTPLRALFPAKNQRAANEAIRRLNQWLKENA